MQIRRLGCLALALALSVRIAHAGAQTGGSGSSRLLTVTGVVKTASASSLTLERGDNEIAFAVRPSTRLVAKAHSRDLVLRDRKPVISDIVKAGDRVTVVYRRSGRLLNAVQVRVVQRSLQ